MKFHGTIFAIVTLAVFLASGCGDNSGDGGDCKPRPDASADASAPCATPGAPSGTTLLGTCFDENTEGEAGPVCQESWASVPSSVKGMLRDEAGANCEDEPDTEWTRADDVCPKEDGYLGTCVVDTGTTYSENSWYAPREEDLPAACEATGGTWVVE